MDRRSFLALIVAGCADPSLEPSLGVTTPAPQPAAGTPAVPAIPAPSASLTPSGDPNFDAWMAGFYNRATSRHFLPRLLGDALFVYVAPHVRFPR